MLFMKKLWLGFDTETVGIFVGYFSLIFRAMTLLSMILLLFLNINEIVHTSTFDELYLELYLYIFILLIYIFATAAPVAWIFGIKHRLSKFLLPYLIFEGIQILLITLFALYIIPGIIHDWDIFIASLFVCGKMILFIF